MRIARSTLIGTAVAMALFGRNNVVQAQTSGDATTSNQNEQLQEVVVTGIRASLEQSIELKRNADSVVDVVTAEDIGKMPDKNIADSLKRVPGVTISSAGASEGGFDENDRVSLRGTGPSLTQTLINGHNVASGDWFVLNQVTTVGRSVSYTLLPSELVSKVVVHKSSEADLVEGGVSGTVDIITRRALTGLAIQLEVSLALHTQICPLRQIRSSARCWAGRTVIPTSASCFRDFMKSAICAAMAWNYSVTTPSIRRATLRRHIRISPGCSTRPTLAPPSSSRSASAPAA
jgi:hypothetical protein